MAGKFSKQTYEHQNARRSQAGHFSSNRKEVGAGRYQPLTMKISLCGKYHGWEKAYQGTNIGVFCIKCKFLSNFSTKQAKKVAKCLQIEIKIVNLQP
ncbi:MAG: hypothetical protein IIT33_05800 [Prevotella sp.]|nr:hypothetical protein [Prevotella sp.]